MRKLEIGPGSAPLEGFESVDIQVGKAKIKAKAQKLPFKDNSFEEVYSSHCIEHVEWFEIEDTIKEWARVLKPGGLLEVHTLDSTKFLKALLDYEYSGITDLKPTAWKKELHKNNPVIFSMGRIMSYSKKGDKGANLHRAIITPRFLTYCFESAGLINISKVDEPRGRLKHKGVNLGLKGFKP